MDEQTQLDHVKNVRIIHVHDIVETFLVESKITLIKFSGCTYPVRFHPVCTVYLNLLEPLETDRNPNICYLLKLNYYVYSRIAEYRIVPTQ